MWLTSLVPPLVTVFVFTPIYLQYVGSPTDFHLALLVAASVALVSIGTGLSVRFVLILQHEPAPPKREKVDLRQLATFGLALLGFLAVYLMAIYSVLFGLWPLHESSEAGAIATTVILLAIMIGLPVALYFGLRALGFKDSWTS